MQKEDIVNVIFNTALKNRNENTHDENCWLEHPECMSVLAGYEILALRASLAIAAGLVSTLEQFKNDSPETVYRALFNMGVKGAFKDDEEEK